MNPFYENKDAPLQSSSSLNMEFPEHLHGHTEILFVRQGRIRVNIMGESRELKEGDCAVIFPQKIHSYHSPGGSLSWLLIFGSTLAGSLCSAWIQVLLANIMPLLSLQKENQPESMELIHRLVHYVMEHFQEPLTLEVLARELHINKYYLSHIFSSRLHMNFRGYLNRIRLEYALQLIRSTRQPLTDVWEDAGFNSQRSFNRVFQETMGMTPLEYRKSIL